MGREMVSEDEVIAGSLERKPGVLLIGCPDVGKRTILSRLLSIDNPEVPILSSGILCQGFTLETKYYSAELSIWTCHLDEGFSFQKLLASEQLVALVMVFDMSDETSFLTLKNWITGIDIGKFEILLCVGNKADLVSDHYAHVEYRRRLQKHGESAGDPHPEFWDYGIHGTESSSLLGNEDPSVAIRKNCLEWCIAQNIEYIEACASNVDFDKCLSVDGDVQGVERIYGALAAHMWPGMILKTGDRINYPVLIEKEDSTDDESEYEIEYEALSGGDSDDEHWDYADNRGPSSVLLTGNEDGGLDDEGTIGYNGEDGTAGDHGTEAYSASRNPLLPRDNLASDERTVGEHGTGKGHNQDQEYEQGTERGQTSASELERQDRADAVELHGDSQFSYDDLERLMGEIGNMRGNLRLMPDFQRREMAANLAMKMAAMFGESGDEDGF